jgi:hypothetical protein
LRKESIMGLDITAYSQLKDTGRPFDWDVDEGNAYIPGNHPDFAARCVEFTPGNAFEYKVSYRAHIGLYIAYGHWREKLAKLAGYSPVVGRPRPYSEGAWTSTEGPFWELIDFTDCDGVLGTAVCQKLAEDFANYETSARRLGDEDFLYTYLQFKAAVEFASDGGAVVFR